MNVIPTHRPWITAGRMSLAVALLALLGSAALMLAGVDAAATACLASAR